MRTKVTKQTLIDDFFVLTSKDSDSRDTDRFIIKLEKYLDAKESDAQLTLILLSLKTIKADSDQQDFLKCCAIAAPIFEQLEVTTNWGYLDFYILASVIGYHSDYNKTHELFQEAIDVLEDKEYVNDLKFKAMVTVLHINITLRMIRAMYFEPQVNKKALAASFKHSYKYAMDWCTRKNLPFQYVLQVRRGIFENHIELVDTGLSKLHELGEKKRYKTTKDEIVEYLFYMDDELSQPLERYLIGYQLRKRRKEIGMEAIDIAIALDSDQNTITAIERGEYGISIARLKKISKILGVGAAYLLGDESQKPEDTDPFILKVKARMTKATESDKDAAIKLIEIMMENKYPDSNEKDDNND